MVVYFILLCLLAHNDAPTLMYWVWGAGIVWEIIKTILGGGADNGNEENL